MHQKARKGVLHLDTALAVKHGVWNGISNTDEMAGTKDIDF